MTARHSPSSTAREIGPRPGRHSDSTPKHRERPRRQSTALFAAASAARGSATLRSRSSLRATGPDSRLNPTTVRSSRTVRVSSNPESVIRSSTRMFWASLRSAATKHSHDGITVRGMPNRRDAVIGPGNVSRRPTHGESCDLGAHGLNNGVAHRRGNAARMPHRPRPTVGQEYSQRIRSADAQGTGESIARYRSRCKGSRVGREALQAPVRALPNPSSAIRSQTESGFFPTCA